MTYPDLLTIAIPTRNGGETLSATLASVILALQTSDQGRVSVLIVDNASDSKTQQVIDRYVSQVGFSVRVIRQEIAVEYDRNINTIFENANSIFVKLLADDDLIFADGILTLLEALAHHPTVDILVHEFEFMDGTCTRKLSDAESVSKEVELYSKSSAALAAAKYRYGQVSSLLYRVDCWRDCMSADIWGSNYIHSQVFIRQASKSNVLIIGKPVVVVRAGSPNFSGDAYSEFITPLLGLKGYRRSLQIGEYPRAEKQAFMAFQLDYTAGKALRAVAQGWNLNLSDVAFLILCAWDSRGEIRTRTCKALLACCFPRLYRTWARAKKI